MRHKKVRISAVLFLGLSLTVLHAQTIKDIDGNVYKTVAIGTQTWMAHSTSLMAAVTGGVLPRVVRTVSGSGA
jgi:hypothetical protein